MQIKRREFFGTALAAGVAVTARSVEAQGKPVPQPKTWTAKVEKLWNIPSYKNMNALETAPDGAAARRG